MNLNRIIGELIESEGLKLKPYKCTSGKLTIGIGRNLEDKGITRKEAVELCNNDLIEVRNSLFRFAWYRHLDEVRQEAIIRMAFNMGVSDLLEFKKMIAALELKDWETAAYEALDSRWSTQVGDRSIEIAEIIRSGRYK